MYLVLKERPLYRQRAAGTCRVRYRRPSSAHTGASHLEKYTSAEVPSFALGLSWRAFMKSRQMRTSGSRP